MKLVKTLFAAMLISFSFSGVAHAVVTTDQVEVTKLRVMRSGDVYVMVSPDSSGLCDGPFRIKNSDVNKNILVSTALTAFSTGKKLRIELTADGCIGYGTLIGSMFIVP